MTYFRDSLKRAKTYLLFIPFLALNETVIRNESTRIYAFFLNTLAFILYAIVYGSIVEEIALKTKSEWSHLLKRHLLNLVAATFILYIPVFATSYLNSEEHYLRVFAFKGLIGFVIQCATLYLMPLVFLKRKVLSSFPQALRYIAHHLLQSTSLIALVLLGFALKYIVAAVNAYYFETEPVVIRYGFKYIHDLVSTYIGLVIFSMASSLLISNEPSFMEVKQSNPA